MTELEGPNPRTFPGAVLLNTYGSLLQLQMGQSHSLQRGTRTGALTLLEVQLVVRCAPRFRRRCWRAIIVQKVEACLQILSCAIRNEPESSISSLSLFNHDVRRHSPVALYPWSLTTGARYRGPLSCFTSLLEILQRFR